MAFRVVASFHYYFKCTSPLTCLPCSSNRYLMQSRVCHPRCPLCRKLQSTSPMASGLSVDGLQNSCPVITSFMWGVPRAYPSPLCVSFVPVCQKSLCPKHGAKIIRKKQQTIVCVCFLYYNNIYKVKLTIYIIKLG